MPPERIRELEAEREQTFAELYSLGHWDRKGERRATLTRRLQLLDARIAQEHLALGIPEEDP